MVRALTWFSFLRMLLPACLRCCSRLSFGRCHSDCWGIACPDFPPALSHWHAWPVHLFYIAAFHYLPSHQVALFTATTPIYVVLIDGLMKKNLPPLHLAAAILAAMGGAGILWKGYSSGNGELTGIVLAAACMVSLAGCGSSEKKEVNVEKPEDLKTLTIGVQQGTTGDILSSEQVEKDSQMKRYPKGSTAIQALKNGKIDCVVIDSEPAAKFVEKNQDLKIIDGVFETEEYAMCVKKGNTELLDEMNKALEELKEDGTVDKIIGNYIGDDTGKYQYESPADVDHSKGTLVMATNAEFEPYEYHEGDGIVGIDVDLSRAICDKMGYDLEILDMEFDSILPSIAAGKADFGAAGMTVDAERQKNADFTDTYANASQVIIVKK